MDTNRLRYFCAVSELGSMTKASELLGISHSGLSKSLTLLQQEVELPLLKPLGRGIEITPEGKAFYQKALEILRLVDNLKVTTQPQVSVIRVALSEVIALSCAALIAEEFQKPILLQPSNAGELEELILGNQIDFGVSFVPQPQPELEYLKITEITFNAYARADLAEKFQKDIPFAVPTSNLPSNPMGYKIRDGWPGDLPRNSFYFAENFATALNLLQGGQAAANLPDFLVKLENKKLIEKYRLVKLRQFKGAKTCREVFLVKRKLDEETSEMKKVAKVLRKIL